MIDSNRASPIIKTTVMLSLFCWMGVNLLNGVTDYAELSELDNNLIIGTQAIGGPYQFTDKPYLLEVAQVLESMGSNQIKFVASPRYDGEPYHLDSMDEICSLKGLMEMHPVYQSVLTMDFLYYHFWAREFGRIRWQDGLDPDEEIALYREFRDLSEWLLTAFNGTNKRFFIGHWEGDWLLLPSRNRELDPDPLRIRGFIQYLSTRQRAIEDARRSIKDTDVEIYHYTEVNLVIKGMDGSHPTVTNAVLPHVDVDYVSYSSYDSIKRPDMRAAVRKALDHIESIMVPRPNWPGKRVFVGEFAIHAAMVDFDPAEHERRNREVLREFIEWGCPFVLYWQVYCNELSDQTASGHKGFWLIDPDGTQYPLYYTFKNYWQAAGEFIREHKQSHASSPTFEQMQSFALDYLADD